jgi:uncharacterized DUF497 family protein
MQFEWDDEKAEKNNRKHRVSFETAIQAFNDPNRIEFFDQEHSTKEYESRFQLIGLAGVRLLFVVFTETQDSIRIIHARKADKRMQRMYDESSQE